MEYWKYVNILRLFLLFRSDKITNFSYQAKFLVAELQSQCGCTRWVACNYYNYNSIIMIHLFMYLGSLILYHVSCIMYLGSCILDNVSWIMYLGSCILDVLDALPMMPPLLFIDWSYHVESILNTANKLDIKTYDSFYPKVLQDTFRVQY